MKFKLVLVLIWMVVIFCLSNQPASISSNLSNGLINDTIVKIYEIFNGKIDMIKREEILSKYSYPVRKLAHFTEYFILGFLVLIFLMDYINEPRIIVYCVLICFIYACTDEFHQYFVVGRNCSFLDVIIDTIGSLISSVLFSLKKLKLNNFIKNT